MHLKSMAGRGGDQAWNREKIKDRIEENELDLSLCSISKVPVQHILPFTKITVLDLSCNKINILPDTFSKLQQLIHLDLSKNGITELPEDFGELTKLRKLDLFKNHLGELPVSFYKLKNLQWLDLKANPIQESFPKLVGDCLKPAECQQCARNIVDHYSNLHNEQLMRERRAKKLEAERLAKQKQEEEKVRQRRKEEKKKRIEERKSEQKNQKNVENINGTISQEEDEVTAERDSKASSGICKKFILYLFLLTFLGTLTAAVILGVKMDWDIEAIHGYTTQVIEEKKILLAKLKNTYSL